MTARAPAGRVYLDWNASAPLRPEARAAMLAAMDALGNPSSVHAEGRAAHAVVERARGQVARLAGCDPEQVVFTSGATEANAMGLRGARAVAHVATGHASLLAAARREAAAASVGVDGAGRFDPSGPAAARAAAALGWADRAGVAFAFEAANGETGVLTPVAGAAAPDRSALAAAAGAGVHCDAAQALGRTPFVFAGSGLRTAAASAHKLGGPKGVGALIHDDRDGPERFALAGGGGQERGARPGTENLVGIAGFGAAAEAALRDLEAGAWEAVAARRDRLEARLAEVARDAVFPGSDAPRLPNTLCVATPGWAGETQVMQLDLAGFAVSAGAACSSGRVRPSHVLAAMGFDERTAASAIRVSLGPATTDDEIDRFAETWAGLYARRRRQAA